MKTLLCDSGPLIASYNRRDPDHERCTRPLARWPRLEPLRWVLQEN
ncbi:MAG: hypothetical protein ACRDRK_23400 [Pseudonocardia sp.]